MIVYRCRSCGFILYVFVRVGQDSYGVPTPSEIASWYGGICPRCGKPIGKPRLHDVVVKPIEAAEVRVVVEEVKRQGKAMGYAWFKLEEELERLTGAETS